MLSCRFRIYSNNGDWKEFAMLNLGRKRMVSLLLIYIYMETSISVRRLCQGFSLAF